MKDSVCVGVVGSGIISDIYLKNMTQKFDNLRVKSVSARHLERAQEKAARYGLHVLEVLQGMLKSGEDKSIHTMTTTCSIPLPFYD